MQKKRKPAGNCTGAWPLQERESRLLFFGDLQNGRLDFEEELFGTVGKLWIRELDPENNVENYVRTLAEEEGIARAEGNVQGVHRSCMAFASRKEDIFYYELSSEGNTMNMRIEFQPRSKRAYVNHNMGGIYFEIPYRGMKTYLLGKCEYRGDGFPKADETGITVRNASRIAFRIYLKAGELTGKGNRQSKILDLQMQMNRYLARLDSISREMLIKGQEE